MQDVCIHLRAPLVGEGRLKVFVNEPVRDAIFAFAIKSQLRDVFLFLSSLKDASFDGIVVLAVLPHCHPDMPDELWDFLLNVNDFSSASNMNVIVHTLDLSSSCIANGICTHGRSFYYNTSSLEYIDDLRPSPRTLSQLRFEFYAAWLLRPQTETYSYRYGRIMLSDLRDVFFQKNPFSGMASHQQLKNTLIVFEEFPTRIKDQPHNREWIRNSRGEQALDQIGHNYISCSGTTFGGRDAMEAYLLHMLKAFDETPEANSIAGMDQGHHNFVVHSGRLNSSIDQVVIEKQGYSIVNTVGIIGAVWGLRQHGILDNATNEVLNYDGTVSPVVHQYDRDAEFTDIFEKRYQAFINQLQ